MDFSAVQSSAPSTLPPAAPTRLPARALYIAGSWAAAVTRDGPALLVHAAQRAPSRYPLARVSRVMSGTSVNWSPTALSACLENGIPVVFVGVDGTPAGYLQPMVRRPSSFHALLEELMDHSGWLDRYSNWMRSERMRAFKEWKVAAEVAGRPIGPAEELEIIRRHVYGAAETPRLGGKEGSTCRSAIMTIASQYAVRAGLRHIYIGADNVELRPVEDLSRLLELALALELRGLGSSAQAETGAILRVFEAFAARIEDRCTRILGRLHRHVTEVLNAWR